MVDDFLNASHARFTKKFNDEWTTAANADMQTIKYLLRKNVLFGRIHCTVTLRFAR